MKNRWYTSTDTKRLLNLATPEYPDFDTRKKYRQWFVPPEVAIVMVEIAERFVQTDIWLKDVLEPSCGGGMLLAAAKAMGRWDGHLVGLDVEPQPNWNCLSDHGIEFYDVSERAMGSLSLSTNERHPASRYYDVILMHPPFGRGISGSDKGTKWTKDMIGWARNMPDLKSIFDKDVYSIFVGHFLKFLRPGGIMVCLTPVGWWYDSSFEEMRKYFLDPGNIDTFLGGVDLFGVQLWRDAAVDCAISVIQRARVESGYQVWFIKAKRAKLKGLPGMIWNQLDQIRPRRPDQPKLIFQQAMIELLGSKGDIT